MTAKKTNPVILGVIAAGVVALLAAGIWLLISAMSASVEESHPPAVTGSPGSDQCHVQGQCH
jgi:hypothetical protein